MARVNVFGKPIVYDVGSVIINDVRRPPSTEIKEGDDVTSQTKDQLASYVADETKVNDASVPATPVRELSLTDKDGFPATLSDTNPNKFSSDSVNLNSYSDSSQNTGVGGVAFIKKGKAQGALPNGNQLLKGVTSPDDQTIVPKYTSKILNQNRFTDAQKRTGTEQFRVNPAHPVDTLGSWKNYRGSVSGKDFGDGDLAHVGTLLTLRATKEFGALDAYGRDGPDGAGASLATILPGGSQSGLLKVNVSDMDALDVLTSLIDAGTESANLDASKALSKHNVLAINTESYGQMNNSLEPFTGLLPLGMIGLSTALVLALKIAIRAVLAVFLLITSASKSGSQRTDSIGRYFLGNYNKSAAFDTSAFPPIPLPASLFGLRETIHPFGDAVDAGIEAFFGGGVGDSFVRILETPGFYAVFCRSIVMSAATITDSIKGVVKGNPIQVAQNIIELVNVIKSSKVVAAMNVFAEIGDAALALKDKDGSLSMIDDLEDENSTGFKSRLKDRLALAWGVGNSPSAYLIPASFQSSLAVYSQLSKNSLNPALVGLVKSEIDAATLALGTSDKALDRTVVEYMESKLDAEYMPFYFHDLRTHEIVAFPAFITTLTDDFSVNWESSEGFGRVDAVKTYRSTARKIALSFIVASTSPQDFDQMWWKINKFITMIYPQWSEGTLLQNNDDGVKFVQPFSQVMTSSPVVRIRLGDLLRSNYSRFALARLFGVGQVDRFKLPDLSDIKFDGASAEKLQVLVEKHFNPDKPLEQDVFYDAIPGTYDEAESATGGGLGSALAAAASAIGIGGSAKPKDRLQLATHTKCVVKKAIDNNTYHIFFVDASGQQRPEFRKAYVAKRSQLAVNGDSLLDLLKKSGINVANVTQSDIDTLGKFFDAKNNAVVRSFESVSGKGLACTIDSLNFAWLDNTTWETEIYGSRAPKMCKINLSITPIHDIAPGIDSDGFNRAPVYNVGQAVNAFGGDSYDDAGSGKKSFDTRMGKLFTKTFRR
jgi:hypothetical protein